MNQNLARAVGPAIGGVLLAATSAAIVFLADGRCVRPAMASMGGDSATSDRDGPVRGPAAALT